MGKLSVRKECHWTRVRKALLRTACCRFVGHVSPGRASFATANSTRCWKWSSDRCVGECDCLGTHNAIQPRARPSKSNSTPRRRDGFLLLCTFFPQVVEGSVFPRGTHVLPTTWWVVIYFFVSAGRVGVSPVLVKVDFHWRVFGYTR